MKCPRCQSSITASPDSEGFLTCPGCRARLRSRSAPATLGALDARAARPATPLAEGSHDEIRGVLTRLDPDTERFPDATNPNATLPPGTPLPRIPRPGSPEARAALAEVTPPRTQPRPVADDTHRVLRSPREVPRESEEASRGVARNTAAGLEALMAEVQGLRRSQDEMLALLRAGSFPAGERPGFDVARELGLPVTPTVRARQRKTVLIVDDDPETRLQTEAALDSAEIPFRSVVDGRAALAAIADDKPDVIVMELDIAGTMAGKDVINLIKATMQWVDVPIVLYTRAPITSQRGGAYGARRRRPSPSGRSGAGARRVVTQSQFRRAGDALGLWSSSRPASPRRNILQALEACRIAFPYRRWRKTSAGRAAAAAASGLGRAKAAAVAAREDLPVLRDTVVVCGRRSSAAERRTRGRGGDAAEPLSAAPTSDLPARVLINGRNVHGGVRARRGHVRGPERRRHRVVRGHRRAARQGGRVSRRRAGLPLHHAHRRLTLECRRPARRAPAPAGPRGEDRPRIPGRGRRALTRLGASTVVALMALALGLATSPDLPFQQWQPAVGGVVAGLTALFVVALVDRRAPRRLVAVGAATFALAVGYDAVRGEQGSMTLAPGQGTRTFDEEGPRGRALGFHPIGDAVVLEAIEPDGTVVLGQTDAQRHVRVSPRRAAAVAGYRIGTAARHTGAAGW
jgi:CheY-like chemotaxis protein